MCGCCLQIKFRLARQGLMKAFEGSWSVQPFNQQTLDRLNASEAGPSTDRSSGGKGGGQWFKPAMAFANNQWASLRECAAR